MGVYHNIKGIGAGGGSNTVELLASIKPLDYGLYARVGNSDTVDVIISR